MEILQFTSEEAAAPLMSVVLDISRKNLKFWNFLQILKIMENFEKLRITISKVGGKF